MTQWQMGNGGTMGQGSGVSTDFSSLTPHPVSHPSPLAAVTFFSGARALRMSVHGDAEKADLQRRRQELAPVMEELGRLLRPADTVYVVGAGTGYEALCLAARLGPGGTVFAFEPDPWRFARLEENLAINVALRLRAVRLALGQEQGELPLSCGPQEQGFSPPARVGHYPGRQVVRAPAVSLDAFISNHGPPDILFVGARGWETMVLRGARRTLRMPALRALHLELQSDDDDAERTADRLRKTLAQTGFHESWSQPSPGRISLLCERNSGS